MKSRNLEVYQGSDRENNFSTYFASYYDKDFNEKRILFSSHPDLMRWTFTELYGQLKEDGIMIKDILNIKPKLNNGFIYSTLSEQDFLKVQEVFKKIKEDKETLEDKISGLCEHLEFACK